jgi:hypothetical protein
MGSLLLAAAGLAIGAPCTQPCPSYLYQPCYTIDKLLRCPAVPYLPQPGDIMLVCDDDRFWEITHNMALAFRPHGSGIVVALPEGSLGILEAGPNDTLWVGISPLLPHLHEYHEKGEVWIRKRKTPLTCEQSAALTEFALRQNGKHFALWRLAGQLTVLRSRGPIRTYFMGKPQGDRRDYFCSELVTESCVAAGLIDPACARPAATYPHDLFTDRSLNPFLRRHFSLADCWEPPARWTYCPCSVADDGREVLTVPPQLLNDGKP